MRTDQRIRFIFLTGSPVVFGILTGILNAAKLLSRCRQLRKPPLTLPGPLSILLWLIAYIAIGLACYLVSESHSYREEKTVALITCGSGLLLHWFWMFVFCHTKLLILGALLHLIYTLAVLLNTTLFLKIDKRAGGLMMPTAALSVYYTYITIALIFVH